MLGRISKILLPQRVLNKLLLEFPFLYAIKFIYYESYLRPNGGIEDLISQLGTVFHLEGNIIECGSARCGTSIIIASHLQSRGTATKKIYSLDLFGGGFDIKELEKEREFGLIQASNKAFTYNSYEYVKKKIEKLGLSDIVIPIQGLFRDTLPKINSKFCLSLIDCDLKESTAFCANRVWLNLSKDGVMLFDDYISEEFKGVKPAVDDFVVKHQSEISEHRLLNRLYCVRKK